MKTEEIPRCPDCGRDELHIERRINGNAICPFCSWAGPYAECFPLSSLQSQLTRAQERLKVYEEVCGELMNALEKHHNEWSDNDTCLAECTKLCNALESAKSELEKLKPE